MTEEQKFIKQMKDDYDAMVKKYRESGSIEQFNEIVKAYFFGFAAAIARVSGVLEESKSLDSNTLNIVEHLLERIINTEIDDIKPVIEEVDAIIAQLSKI